MFANYAAWEPVLAASQLIFFMLGMGATLTVRDFQQVATQPGTLVLGVLAQFVMAPLLALGVSTLAGLDPKLTVGLILVSLMPGASIAKVFTYLGKGNVALTITLGLVTTLSAVIVVPVMMRLLAARYVPDNLAVPP